jgi:hypothetical protein
MYRSSSFCFCSPYKARETHVRDSEVPKQEYTFVVPTVIVPHENLNIIIDGDNYVPWVLDALIKFFERIANVIVIVSPFRYIGCTAGQYGSEIRDIFLQHVEKNMVYTVPPILYVPDGGCEDAVLMHVAKYHTGIIISNDTFKEKIGECHELLDDVKSRIIAVSTTGTEITFSQDLNDCLTNLNHSVKSSCRISPCFSTSCVRPVVLRHRAFNVLKNIERNDKTISAHLQKLEKYKCQRGSLQSELEKFNEDSPTYSVLTTKLATIDETVRTYLTDSEVLIKCAHDSKTTLNSELTQLETLNGSKFVFSLVITDDIPFNIFGSSDSKDVDMIVFLNEIPKNTEESQKLCLSLKHRLQQKYKFDGPLNINLGIVNDGVISWVFKGLADETNNSVYTTYSSHTQYHHLGPTRPIARTAIRYVQNKLLRTIRILLQSLTKTSQRHNVKIALRNNVLGQSVDLLKMIAYEKVDYKKITKVDLIDTLKSIAFQMGQCMALLKSIELFSKMDVSAYDPRLTSFLYRSGDLSQLNILTDVKDEFMIMIEDMYERYEGFRFLKETESTI